MVTKASFKQDLHSDFWTYKTYHKRRESEIQDSNSLGNFGLFYVSKYIANLEAFVAHSTSIVLAFTGFVILGIVVNPVLFPVYWRVSRLNREKENDSPIYPILQHFNRIVCFHLVLMLLFILQLILIMITQMEALLSIGFFPYLVVSATISPVFNTLLILLAIQRFIIYFLPDFERFISFKSKTWSVIVVSLYGISLACSAVYFRSADWSVDNTTAEYLRREESNLTEFGNVFDEVYLETQAKLNFLSMASVILYCPIFVSIRTKHHLISALQSKPDRYIRYQAVFVAISKIMNAVYTLYHFMRAHYDHYMFREQHDPRDRRFEMLLQSLANFGATPFIIQVTYLSCNKRNVQAMLSMICPGRCLCCNPRRNNLVAPVMLMDGETTVHAIPNN
ncbi:unnamed protein product [Caenorhabditis brenneri]